MDSPIPGIIALESRAPTQALKAAWDRYMDTVNEQAEDVFAKIVRPFLRRRRWTFCAGNGTFWIGPKGGDCVFPDERPNDADLKEIFDVLNTAVPGWGFTLGSLMPDYPRTKRA